MEHVPLAAAPAAAAVASPLHNPAPVMHPQMSLKFTVRASSYREVFQYKPTASELEVRDLKVVACWDLLHLLYMSDDLKSVKRT